MKKFFLPHIFFAIGLIVIFSAPNLALTFSSKYIESVGGSTDLTVYSTILSIYASCFQLIGFLISFSSVFYHIFKRKDNIK